MSSESKTAAGPLTSSRDVLLQGVLDALSESPEAVVRDSIELARGAGYDHAALVGVIKSLAAGGSMVHPQVPGVLLTPICPHSLSFRPLVFPDSVMLRVQVPAKSQNSAFVAFDGKGRQELRPGEAVEVCISRWALPEVCLDSPTTEWFNAITHGLHWNRAATRIASKRRYGGQGNIRLQTREKRPCDR